MRQGILDKCVRCRGDAIAISHTLLPTYIVHDYIGRIVFEHSQNLHKNENEL